MVLYRKFRPERLQFHQHCHAASSAAVAVAALPTTCAQEARLTADANPAALSGGFASFAASYPQYCESKCPAAATGFGSCCQPLAEPSFSTTNGPTQLFSYLFVGSQTDALDADVIRQHGITHVLNVSKNCPQSQHVPATNFLRVPVNDGYADKLMPHFKRAFQFLDSVRRSNGRCLVHCLAGISRSPTLTIAYIMQHRRVSQDEAYRFVKSRRPGISPNFNFLGQLLEFERMLQAATTTSADVADAVADAVDGLSGPDFNDDGDDACSEAKRQRRFLLLGEAPPTPPTMLLPSGQSPTSALSRLTFVQQQQQKLQAQSGQSPPSAGEDPPTHQRRRQQPQRQRPRSVALTGSAAAEASAIVAMVPSSASAGSLGGSPEITCS